MNLMRMRSLDSLDAFASLGTPKQSSVGLGSSPLLPIPLPNCLPSAPPFGSCKLKLLSGLELGSNPNSSSLLAWACLHQQRTG